MSNLRNYNEVDKGIGKYYRRRLKTGGKETYPRMLVRFQSLGF